MTTSTLPTMIESTRVPLVFSSSTRPDQPGTRRWKVWSGNPKAVSYLCVVVARSRTHAIQVARQSFRLTAEARAEPWTQADLEELLRNGAATLCTVTCTQILTSP